MAIPPLVLLRTGVNEGGFIAPMVRDIIIVSHLFTYPTFFSTMLQVAIESIMLWCKVLFFGLAVDGLGTFI